MTDIDVEQLSNTWARLLRAQNKALSHVETELKTAGFPPLVWYDVLLELSRDSEDGLRAVEIQKRMLLPQYGISRLLDRIEKAGYIYREVCEEDGRGQQIHITDLGKALLKKMWPVYKQALIDAIGVKLTSKEIKTLGTLLSKIQ